MFCKHFNFFESVHTKFKTWNRGCMEYFECSTYKYSRQQQQQLVYMLECPEDRRLFSMSLSLQENSTSTKGTSQNVPQNINFKQQQLPFLKKKKTQKTNLLRCFCPPSPPTSKRQVLTDSEKKMGAMLLVGGIIRPSTGILQGTFMHNIYNMIPWSK